MKYLPETFVDLHIHPHLKSYMFDRGINKRKFLSKVLKHSFWPFSHRSTLGELGDYTDVALATTYVMEREWLEDVPLIKFLSKLAPGFRKKMLEPSYFDVTRKMMEHLEKQVNSFSRVHPDIPDEIDEPIAMAKCPNDILKNISAAKASVIHSVEGAHSLIGDGGAEDHKQIIFHLKCLGEMGCAYLTLAHFYPNPAVASCVFPYPESEKKMIKNYWKRAAQWETQEGLTKLGKELVEVMLDIGMLIDITHLDLQGRRDVYDIVDANDAECAVIASHVGARGVHRIPYNLSDQELRWLADRGCCAGIIFMNYWLSPHNPKGSGLKYIEETVSHMINVAGEDVVAIGSDLDGFTDPPDEIPTVKEFNLVARHLLEMGYSYETTEKFMGENAMRVLLNGWHNEENSTRN